MLGRLKGEMRIPADFRRCVLFLGHVDDRPGRGGIECIGTAFLVRHEKCLHLVTAKHVAKAVEGVPFLIRVNMLDGSSQNRLTDFEVQWHMHGDGDVDLAASLFPYDFTDCDVKALPSDIIADDKKLTANWVGIGDTTYTVGLFRVLQGEKRNLTVVHTGNVAAMPNDERIPVDDWDQPGERRYVEGYLVETQSLRGLSGAPVFVRPSFISPEFTMKEGPPVHARLGRLDLLLLGVWQGAWDARADEVLGVERGSEIRVPVGMGIVVPSSKLMELLEGPELNEARAAISQQRVSQS